MKTLVTILHKKYSEIIFKKGLTKKKRCGKIDELCQAKVGRAKKT